MATDYKSDGVDTDDIYEPWRTGDPRSVETEIEVDGVDLNQRYCAASTGTQLTGVFDYAVDGVDFNQLWAALNSVPRYPNPLPWARTVPADATIYRQPSRPTHIVGVVLSISVNRSGAVAITLTKPPYNSNPATPVVETIYSSGDTPVWTDAGPSPNCPYEVKIDAVSGIAPTLAHGHTLGTWINPNIVVGVENVTMFVRLDYSHSTVEGLKTGTSAVRISLRRSQYPVSNTANAVVTTNFALTVEPTVYQDSAWNGTHVGINNAPSNNHQPEGQVNIHKSAVRFTLSTVRTYIIERAAWKNNETPVWTVIKSAQWLRDGFSLSDFEAMFSATSGSFDGDDTGVALGTWLQLGATARTLTVAQHTSDATLPGTYTDSMGIRTRLRQISTKDWAGLPDNFVEAVCSLVPSVTIFDPIAPTWPSLAALAGPFSESKNINHTPEGGGGLATSQIRLVIGLDGSAVVYNSEGTVLANVTWKPATLTVAQLEVRIVAATAISNNLSNWTTLTTGAGEAIISTVTADQDNPIGSYTDADTFTFEVRRKAWTPHGNSQTGSANVAVNVVAPVVPSWTPTYPWEGSHNDIETHTRNTDLPSGGQSAYVLIRFYQGGLARVYADDGQLLAEGNWLPAGANPAHYNVRVSGSSILDNPLAVASTIPNPYVDVTLTRVTYNNSMSDGVYSDTASHTVTITRIAYPSHNDSGSGDSLSRVTVAPMPLTITPPGNYDNWAGSFTASVTGAI